jgi:hypothetical protein
MKKISLLVMLMCTTALRAMDDGKTVVTVELDGVISKQDGVGISDFASMAKYPSLWGAAWLLTLFSELKNDFGEIAAETLWFG